MRYYIIICAHNEEAFIAKTLNSVIEQSIRPQKVIVVNDHSSDATEKIIDVFAGKWNFIQKKNHHSSEAHMPGAKVVDAFYAGMELLDGAYDFIVKLDADLILPSHYFERIIELIRHNSSAGILGGFAYEKDQNGKWLLNHPMNKDHVRGAFKTYTNSCFKAIGGLRKAMGWDTVDELLARYYGYTIITDSNLQVKHLRPLGSSYPKKARHLQGKAMYSMRYGLLLTILSALKMSLARKKASLLIDSLSGYFIAAKDKIPYLVTEKEGEFIRKFRWESIKKKLI